MMFGSYHCPLEICVQLYDEINPWDEEEYQHMPKAIPDEEEKEHLHFRDLENQSPLSGSLGDVSDVSEDDFPAHLPIGHPKGPGIDPRELKEKV